MKTSIKNEVVSEGNWTLWLVNETDGSLIREAIVGEKYKTGRGESVKLISGTPPHKPGSTGKVYVEEEGFKVSGGYHYAPSMYYPSVISMKWVKKD